MSLGVSYERSPENLVSKTTIDADLPDTEKIEICISSTGCVGREMRTLTDKTRQRKSEEASTKKQTSRLKPAIGGRTSKISHARR